MNRRSSFLLGILLIVVCLIWYLYQTIGLSVSWRRQSTVLADQGRTGTPLKQAIDRNLTAFGSVCHTPNCIAMYDSVFSSSNRIPPIRHILWKSDRVSAYFAKQLKTWNAIHPDWKYVLWRDSDFEKFVARHYTGVLSKFKSLPENIWRIDMIRYLILHRFGGVYADLDYVLVRPLDRFLKFPAVVTREAEAHALFQFGMNTYPPALLGNPAFMMSEPQHPFFQFCILQLSGRVVDHFYKFAGPVGLSYLLTQYAKDFSLHDNPDGVLIVPASHSFYAFEGNSLVSSKSGYKGGIVNRLQSLCVGIKSSTSVAQNLTAYCQDVNNLDPITDRTEPVYAIHDYNKPRSSYDSAGSPEFHENAVDICSILPNVVMADSIY